MTFDPTFFFLLQCIATIVILCIGETHNLINYVSFINYLSYGVTIAGLLYLRKKKPHLARPIKVLKHRTENCSKIFRHIALSISVGRDYKWKVKKQEC